jgi:hypothetical protein
MPKMKREIGGKDGREQGRLSSDERARLGGSQAADVSEVGGQSQRGCRGGGLRNSSADFSAPSRKEG